MANIKAKSAYSTSEVLKVVANKASTNTQYDSVVNKDGDHIYISGSGFDYTVEHPSFIARIKKTITNLQFFQSLKKPKNYREHAINTYLMIQNLV